MVFSSFDFLFGFLPAVLIGYLITPRRFKNAFLAAASLGFYTIGGGAFVLILLVSIGVDYVAGRIADRGNVDERPDLVRLGVLISLAVNLGMLAYFKYANFFVDQLNELGLGTIAWTSVALPIGISFFTFQSMSYTIDIARGRVRHLNNPVDFALYVGLFPQLIAGPIVRYHEIADEIQSRTVNAERFATGAIRFSHGLAKKVIIADSVAAVADAAFSVPGSSLSSMAAWIGILAYTVQIYFDFSGYSDMAIGIGAMLGFTFPENFNRPYSAVSVTDFWRRWHITLSNWFRDYLYVPLGGSHGSAGTTYRNLTVVFLLTGLWHGANWTFVVWGIYHGAFLIAERIFDQRSLGPNVDKEPVRRAATLFIVIIGWVMFRSPSIGSALGMVGSLFGTGGIVPAQMDLALTPRAVIALAIGVASFLLPRSFVTGRVLQTARTRAAQRYRLATLGLALPYAGAIVATGTFSPFLYYQF